MNAQNDRHTILVIDDTPGNLTLVSGLLRDRYRVKVASNGADGLRVAARDLPDLILLDIMMPDIDGYEVIRRLKAQESTKHIPVIFLTALMQPEDEEKGLSLGAADYITKPISPPILLMRISNQLTIEEAKHYLEEQNHILEDRVRRRTFQLTELQNAAMQAIGALAETRDPETGNHIRRTQHYFRSLAEQVAKHPRFRDELTPETISQMAKSAPLHDIGKVGVPDSILLKPGKLNDEEFEIMKQHSKFGYDALKAAERSLTIDNGFLKFAKQIALHHHEKWDGSGYPDRLAGDNIPLAARIMALADVYDSLMSERPYKKPFSHNESVEIIRKGRGSHFDPDLVDGFLAIEQGFAQIAEQFAD